MDFKGLLDKALAFAKKNPEKVADIIDKAGDMVDKKTGGKFADKVDSVQDKAKKTVRDQ